MATKNNQKIKIVTIICDDKNNNIDKILMITIMLIIIKKILINEIMAIKNN